LDTHPWRVTRNDELLELSQMHWLRRADYAQSPARKAPGYLCPRRDKKVEPLLGMESAQEKQCLERSVSQRCGEPRCLRKGNAVRYDSDRLGNAEFSELVVLGHTGGM